MGGKMVLEFTKKVGSPQPRQPFTGVAATTHWLVNATGLFRKGGSNYQKRTQILQLKIYLRPILHLVFGKLLSLHGSLRLDTQDSGGLSSLE
jgi:hypothetical protein